MQTRASVNVANSNMPRLGSGSERFGILETSRAERISVAGFSERPAPRAPGLRDSAGRWEILVKAGWSKTRTCPCEYAHPPPQHTHPKTISSCSAAETLIQEL